MNEWGVVTVIIALVGLFATVSKPIIKLNKTITELSTDLKQVMTRLDKLEHNDEITKNSTRESHRRLHDRIDKNDELIAEHDLKLENHEIRLNQLEERKQ